MDFSPCSFSLERATARRSKPVDAATVAASSPYYDLTAYPERVVLASVVPAIYTYWIFPSAAEASEFVANSMMHERLWFFCIEKKRPVFAYMDFDRPSAGQSVGSFVGATRRAVALFCCYVTATYGFSAVRDDDTYDGSWWFYESCTADKLSIHAHSRMAFVDVDALSQVAKGFQRWLVVLHEADDRRTHGLFFVTKRGAQKCIVDFAVYTKRPFRLPLNRKGVDARNYLRPLERSSLSQVDHILRGFIHPFDGCRPRLMLPSPSELMRVRSLQPDPMAVHSIADASRELSLYVRKAYQLPATAWDFGQSLDVVDDVDAALGDKAMTPEILSVASLMVEMALFGDMSAFSDFAQRGQLLEVAWDTLKAYGLSRSERLCTHARNAGIALAAGDRECPLDEFGMQVAYVALELCNYSEQVPLRDFLRGERTQSSVAFPSAQAMAAFRLNIPRYLCVPLARTPLASMPLFEMQPFLLVGPRRSAPDFGYA